MNPIRVGIIGCGRIADLHYLGYKDNPRARIFAICDRDEKILEERKRSWGVEKIYRDFREMLTDSQVDAVEILTPQPLHETMVIEAARTKKHIALQKPMAIDLKSADRMIAAAQEAGIIYKVTENYAFYPPIVLAKKMIENGEIGEPASLRIKYIGGSSGGWSVPPAAWEWRVKESAQGRGMTTFDHGHHLWSTAWVLLGEPQWVYARIESLDGIVDCPAIAIWKYKNHQAFGSCDFSQASQMHIPSHYYANDEWIEVTGSRGIIFIRRCTGNIQEGPVVSLFDGSRMRHFDEVKSDWSEGFISATQNFIDAIEGKAKPMLSAEEGRLILRFALSAQKAAQTRREVYPEEMDKACSSWYAWWQKHRERKGAWRQKLFSFLGMGENFNQYESQAKFLTEQLMQRFCPEKVSGWNAHIGLRLTSEKGNIEELFSFRIHQGKVDLEIGKLPENSILILTIPAGIWAAILLGKQKIESAVLLGKIKIEGRAEEALKLKAAFRL